MRELSGALNKTLRTPDYLEATVFSIDAAVITVGHFADAESAIKGAVRWNFFRFPQTTP